MSAGEPWTPEELERYCVALIGRAWGWQSEIAHRLGVTDRTVRRWASGETQLPARVQAELEDLARSASGSRMGFACRDEWIVGDGPRTASRARREYIVHTRPPRFIARVVALDELTDGPEPDEDPVDTETGVAYQALPETLICEIEWLDPVPRGPELARLMEAAADAIEEAGEGGPGG